MLFVGKYFPSKVRASTKGYHGSTIGGVMSSYGVVSHALNISLSLLARVVTFVFKMAGLQELVRNGEEDNLFRRLQIHKKGIGSIGGLVVDADSEDVQWLNLNIAGITEVMRFQREHFTAETELTHDILWNEGSQQTSSDLEAINWQNKINEFIRIHWQANFNTIAQIVANTYGLPYEDAQLMYTEESLKVKQQQADRTSKQQTEAQAQLQGSAQADN